MSVSQNGQCDQVPPLAQHDWQIQQVVSDQPLRIEGSQHTCMIGGV